MSPSPGYETIEVKTLSGIGGTVITSDQEHVYISGGGGGGVNWKLPAPTNPYDDGEQGDVSFDTKYYYVCVAKDQWRRTAIAEW